VLDPQFRALADRMEFRKTNDLLHRYAMAAADNLPLGSLPPPPAIPAVQPSAVPGPQ